MSTILNRVSPSLHQQEFLDKLIPWAVLIQDWTYGKSEFRGKLRSPVGIRASLLVADIILASEWGTHPIAQAEISGKFANNLALLQASKDYLGKIHTYDNIRYRAYKRWHDFAVDYSDYLVYSDHFTDALLTGSLEEQIAYFGIRKTENSVYNGKISALIDFYGLLEIDSGQIKKRRQGGY